MKNVEKHILAERLEVAQFLLFVAGFIDAYTFFLRGGVFATAQSGNLIMLGVELINGHFGAALAKLAPIITFGVGILLTDYVKDRFKADKLNWWRIGVVWTEALIFTIIGFIPLEMPAILVVMAVSFVSSMQITSFNVMMGLGYSNMFSTGNYQKTMNNLYKWWRYHDATAKSNFRNFGSLVMMFITGAIVSTWLSKLVSFHSVWLLAGMLFVFGAIQYVVSYRYYLQEKSLKNL